MVMFLIGISSPPVSAQGAQYSNKTLDGISAVAVVVEDLPDGAKILGLTRETVQNDVELKLRLAGMRVMTDKEVSQIPGMPDLYVRVTLTKGAEAASIEIHLRQNARLERNGQLAVAATTWKTFYLTANPTSQSIRDTVKDGVDDFLNAWLSVNPKK
jgi:hypothetical protein